MRRLYLQIYLTLVGALLVFGLLAALTWVMVQPEERNGQALDGLSLLLSDWLPGPRAEVADQQAALERLAGYFAARLTLRDSGGRLLAVVGEPLPMPHSGHARGGWLRGHGVWALPLTDGRWLLARPQWNQHRGGWLLGLALLALAVAVSAWPLVRRLTRRLERLRNRVERLGEGDLTARVEVEGRDEIADLARSFNRAGARIQTLVEAQRTLLAGASHELRTPLTRIRMAMELLGEQRPKLRHQVARDIAELDSLIGELLLASRLELEQTPRRQAVDLLALAAETAATFTAEVSGEPITVSGDPLLLRRLIQNLLENARRYGGGSAIEVRVEAVSGQRARLSVLDRGPGVPEAERERVFQPFYRGVCSRETGRGVGLGLALVKRIAQQHGGEVCCLARDGGGSRFDVGLPLTPPRADPWPD